MRRHDLDLLSLIAGAVFLVVALSQLFGAATDDQIELAWLVPAVLVGLGAAGMAGALRGAGGGDGESPTGEEG